MANNLPVLSTRAFICSKRPTAGLPVTAVLALICSFMPLTSHSPGEMVSNTPSNSTSAG